MKVRFLPARLRSEKGYTLTELLVALGVTALVALLAVSTLVFFNKANLQTVFNDTRQFEQEYRRIYVYLQKQIDSSEKIFVKDDIVYLQDMESSTKYYDYYEAYSKKDYLYRYKTDKDTLRKIGSGETSQLGGHVCDFSLTAEKNSAGDFTGLLKMEVDFRKGSDEKVYHAVFAYPGGKQNIIQK